MVGANDFAQNLRVLLRRPAQSLFVCSILAVGVGASSAFYSVGDALLLRPLPFDRAGTLVAVEQRLEPSGAPIMNSHLNLNELREQSKTLDAVAVYKGAYGSISVNGETEFGQGMAVDRFFLPLLGVAPARGRGFTVDDELDGAPCAIILSDRFSRRHLGTPYSIVGGNILLDRNACAVIGVMPPSFSFPFPELGTADEDFWIALRDHSSWRGDYDKYGIARIKSTASLRLARTEAQVISAHLTHGDRGRESHAFLLRPYRETIVDEYLPMLAILTGILICVMVVVCINVASLLLVDALRSQREFAIRFALGGSRWQIGRVFIFRVATLTCIGGTGGAALGLAIVSLTRKILPAGIPNVDHISLNPRALWFTAIVSLATGFASGVWPVVAATGKLHVATTGIHSEIKGRPMLRARSSLMVVHLAFSAAFLVITGLFGISLYRLLNVDLGMKVDHRLAVVFKPADSISMTAESLRVLFSGIKQRLASISGVTAVTLSTDAPLAPRGTREFQIKGKLQPRDSSIWIAEATAVDQDYFKDLGVAILRGRSFASQDISGGEPVAIVNELFADRFLGGRSSIGIQICIPDGATCTWREVVGIAANVRDRVDRPVESAYFLPFSQAPKEFLVNASFTVSTNIDPAVVLALVKRQISDFGPRVVPLASFTLQEKLWRQTIAPRARLWISAAIGALALLLAATGVYGVTASMMEQRRRELGIRVAVGASPQRIAIFLVREMSPTLIRGLLIGITGGVVAGRYLTSSLYETSPVNPVAYLGAVVTLSAVAAVASAVPVRRALNKNPNEILRAE